MKQIKLNYYRGIYKMFEFEEKRQHWPFPDDGQKVEKGDWWRIIGNGRLPDGTYVRDQDVIITKVDNPSWKMGEYILGTEFNTDELYRKRYGAEQ